MASGFGRVWVDEATTGGVCKRSPDDLPVASEQHEEILRALEETP